MVAKKTKIKIEINRDTFYFSCFLLFLLVATLKPAPDLNVGKGKEPKVFADEILGKKLFDTPGHNVLRKEFEDGFFMTNVILEHFNNQDLIEVVRNPFQFATLYNKAAVRDGNAP